MPTNKRPQVAFPAANPDYRAARLRTALACQTYNKLPENAPVEQRVAHWHSITNFSSSPSSSAPTSPPRAPYIKSPIYIDYGSNLHIGNSTFINRNRTILDTPVLPVRIGERCLLGPNVSIYAVSHPVDWRERNGPLGARSYASEVVIEDDCWIGGGVTVMAGVTVGRGCVVGAGSVVTKISLFFEIVIESSGAQPILTDLQDIPPEHLTFGVPARIIRSITEETPVTRSDSQGMLATGGQSSPKGMDKVAAAVNRGQIQIQWVPMLAVLLTMLGLWALVHHLLG